MPLVEHGHKHFVKIKFKRPKKMERTKKIEKRFKSTYDRKITPNKAKKAAELFDSHTAG